MNTRRTFSAALLSLALLVGGAPLQATTVVPVTVAQLAQRSDGVVLGTVRNTVSRWHEGFIVTDCEVVVDAVLQGASTLRATTVFVRVAGGVVGTVGQYIPDATVLQPGRSYVLFLQGGEGRVRYLTHLTAAALPLSVDPGGRVVVDPAPGLVGLASGVTSAAPAVRVSMDELSRAVSAAGPR